VSSCCMLEKERGKRVGHEDDIHFGLVGKACKLNEDMHMSCCVLDSTGCEGKPMKVGSHMADET
jgi:hypothetical protein